MSDIIEVDNDLYIPERSTIEPRRLGVLLVVTGLIGLAAAFVLTVEKFLLAKDPDYTPSCNVNPILSCGSIMDTRQAEAFGFPNSFMGLMGFPLLVMAGALLAARVEVPRWFIWGVQLAVTLALGFVFWLYYQSLYVIGALCPYCMVVWVAVIPAFWFVTLANLSNGKFGSQAQNSVWTEVLVKNRWFFLVLIYFLLVMPIVLRFWSAWGDMVSGR